MKLVSFCFAFFTNILLISGKLNGEGKICGRSVGSATIEEKIVAGFDVGYYKYPWYAALMVSNIVACGGSLVGTKTVVTAAHCFKEYLVGHGPSKNKKLEDAYNVSLGIYNRCQKEKTQKTFFIQKVHVHEKYKDNIPYYDVAVLILKESTNTYEPICLPKSQIKNKPREGWVPGLGTLRYHGSTPCTLHEARLLVYSDSECRKMINSTGNDPKKLYRAFCAGYLQGGIDTCQGDSGGPFQIIDEYGNYILMGLVSFGFHCANPNLLGIYTDVSQYVEWIEEKAGFKATMEGSDNSTAVTAPTVTGEITHPSDSTKPHKPTKKPNPVHVIHPTGGRPINIIIINDRSDRKFPAQTTVRKNKHQNQNKSQRKRKNRKRDRTKRPS
ncbi:hypothetical protein Zmor_022030 [Zophobas morio]|uniref:Peptidase S1 domain-containing protein n=1 Tax=Zophobas morio TaxID=2755281 RepID=A0AA38I985_9CUCU|nr:hypothetical protein Zmor_022030 [Zophobas morio]